MSLQSDHGPTVQEHDGAERHKEVVMGIDAVEILTITYNHRASYVVTVPVSVHAKVQCIKNRHWDLESKQHNNRDTLVNNWLW